MYIGHGDTAGRGIGLVYCPQHFIAGSKPLKQTRASLPRERVYMLTGYLYHFTF